MHLIDYQYFEVITTKFKSTDMHDLKTIYIKVAYSLNAITKDCFAQFVQ